MGPWELQGHNATTAKNCVMWSKSLNFVLTALKWMAGVRRTRYSSSARTQRNEMWFATQEGCGRNGNGTSRRRGVCSERDPSVEVGHVPERRRLNEKTVFFVRWHCLFIDKITVMIKVVWRHLSGNRERGTIIHGSLRKTYDCECRRNSCMYHCNHRNP